MERTEQELMDAMRTGKLNDGTPLWPDAKPVDEKEAEGPGKASAAPPEPEKAAAPAAKPAPKPKVTKASRPEPAAPAEEKASEPAPPVEQPAAKPKASKPEPDPPALSGAAPKKSGRERKDSTHVNVSLKVMRFVLGYVNRQPGHQARTVDIGRVAMHDPAVVKRPLAVDVELPLARYTAWGCAPCSKLELQGLLERVLVASTLNGKSLMLAYYRITATGLAWLEAAGRSANGS